MEDYMWIIVFVILFILDLIFSRKKLKNWNELNGVDKMFLIRPLIILFVGIIAFLIKVFGK